MPPDFRTTTPQLAGATDSDSPLADIPRVSGRHKNRALACLRREKAMRMVAEGNTYQQVADELGYANKGTVWRLVQQAMKEHLQPVAEQSRHELNDQLDDLQRALWDKAMAGDVRAGQAIVKIIMQRVRLLGLDQQEAPARPRTLVQPEL